MKQLWFKKFGVMYFPIHTAGYIITVLAIIFMVTVIIAIDKSVHSVSDKLYQIFGYATCTAFWWKWIADKTS